MTIVRVTEQHARAGVRASCTACPVALAMRDAGFGEVHVMGEDAVCQWPEPRAYWLRRRFPPEVGEEIRRFDLYGEMEPFEFQLRAPTRLAGADAVTQSQMGEGKNDSN